MKNKWQNGKLKFFKGKNFPVVLTGAIIIVMGLLFKLIADSQSKVDY